MPKLFNKSEEILCQAIVMRGMTQANAAREAAITYQHAETLLNQKRVIERLHELTAEKEAIEKSLRADNYTPTAPGGPYDPENLLFTEQTVKFEDITIEFLLNQILETGLKARKANQFGAANAAFKMLGELTGAFEKKGVEDEKEKVVVPQITLEDLTAALHKNGLSKLIDIPEEIKKVNE